MELNAYRGNPTHDRSGIHLGYRNDEKRLTILCGLPGEQSGPPEMWCRCSPWVWTDSTELTCRECYEIGKEMHDG